MKRIYIIFLLLLIPLIMSFEGQEIFDNLIVHGNLSLDNGSINASFIFANATWNQLYDYPVACPAGTFVTAINDSVTCSGIGSLASNTTFTIKSDLSFLEFKINNVSLMKIHDNGTLFLLGDIIAGSEPLTEDANVFNFYVNGSVRGQLNSTGDLVLTGDLITNEVVT